jgi:WD40 repeat protein
MLSLPMDYFIAMLLTGPVNCIKITPDKTQFVSASSDGSCIVWDLERYIRLMAFFEPNVFESVLYHPDSSQMLTCGSNHKITYWDASDGQAIRVIDGGDEAMTSLDIEPTGMFCCPGFIFEVLE